MNLMTGKEIGLTDDVRNRILRGIRYDSLEREEIFTSFIKKLLKLNSEDHEDFNKTVVHFDKTLDKRIQKQTHTVRSKKLSYRKRKELGLYTVGKKSLNYKDLLPLNRLWIEYMIKYINLDELRDQSWKNSPEDPNFEQVSLKLYRADFHGSKMSVLKSSCPSYIGISGIVVMETKNCFKLVGRDNIVRTLPKASCVFTFKIYEFEFVFYGKNLQVKPAERSSKKIKTVYISDLHL